MAIVERLTNALCFAYFRLSRIGRNSDDYQRSRTALALLTIWFDIFFFTAANVVAHWFFERDIVALVRDITGYHGDSGKVLGWVIFLVFLAPAYSITAVVWRRCEGLVGPKGRPRDYVASALVFFAMYGAGALNFDDRLAVCGLAFYLLTLLLLVIVAGGGKFWALEGEVQPILAQVSK